MGKERNEPWRYLFIPKSFVTGPSKYFFNSETGDSRRKCSFNVKNIIILLKVQSWVMYGEPLHTLGKNRQKFGIWV